MEYAIGQCSYLCRSYAPSASALRYFPKTAVVLNNASQKGELITTYIALHIQTYCTRQQTQWRWSNL
ncbi:MAG: hypothetical protein R2847_06150 [Bacteroidia bacterium]